MAGFVTGASVPGGYYEFHIDTPDVLGKIAKAAGGRSIVNLQLDGDELAAVLWGIANYKKNQKCVACDNEADLWAKNGTGMCCRCVAVALIEARKERQEAERQIPVQEQLQYQDQVPPECSSCRTNEAVEAGHYTYQCGICGKTWPIGASA